MLNMGEIGAHDQAVVLNTSSSSPSTALGERVRARGSSLLALGYVLIGVGIAVVISSLVG